MLINHIEDSVELWIMLPLVNVNRRCKSLPYKPRNKTLQEIKRRKKNEDADLWVVIKFVDVDESVVLITWANLAQNES